MHVVAEKTYTPEDLLSMPDGKNYELVDGHLVERNMSVVVELGRRASCYFASRRLRRGPRPRLGLAGRSGLRLFPRRSKKVRKPDVSFIRIERLPEGLTSEGYVHIPPDLAVEVVSPNDLWHEVEAKVDRIPRRGRAARLGHRSRGPDGARPPRRRHGELAARGG